MMIYVQRVEMKKVEHHALSSYLLNGKMSFLSMRNIVRNYLMHKNFSIEKLNKIVVLHRNSK